MSISSEIIRLADARTDMKTAIANKGVIVPDGVKYDGIAPLIDAIPTYFPNGTEWTQSNITKSVSDTPIYGNGVWTTGKYYSTDNGKTWTQNTGTYYTPDAFGNGVFVSGNSTFYHSTDGVNWSESTYSANGVYSLGTIRFYKDVFVCTNSTGQILYSSDGMNWSVVKSTGAGRAAEIICENGYFVADFGTTILYSTNGSNWSEIGINSKVGKFSSYYLYYGAGCWFIEFPPNSSFGGSSSSDSGVWNSYNLASWSQIGNYSDSTALVVGCENYAVVSIDGNVTVYGDANSFSGCSIPDYIFYAKGIWHAIDYNGNRYYSTDGNFTECVDYEPNDYTIWNGCGIWLTETQYSIDGINWTAHSGLSGNITTMVYANGIWIAATSKGLFYSVAWEG